MLKIIKKVLSWGLFFVLIAGVCWGLYTIGKWFSQLKPEVAAAIVAICVTALFSVTSLILSKHYELKADVKRQHRENKVEIYGKLIRFFFTILFADKMQEKPPGEKEIIKFFNETNPGMISWSGDAVLKAFSVFWRTSIKGASIGRMEKAILLFEDLLLAIRKDLGHKNKGLERGDILGLFIKDIDEFLAAEKLADAKKKESKSEKHSQKESD